MHLTPANEPVLAHYGNVDHQPGCLEGAHDAPLAIDWPLVEPAVLPATLPSHPRLRFGRFYRRGPQAGADYHDVLSLGGNRFAITMADISGPGAGAAAAMIRAAVRSHAGRHDDSGSLLHYINEHFRFLWHEALFATALCAVVDTRRRTVRLACAGHRTPLLARPGAAVMPLAVHGTGPLGGSGLIVTSEYDLHSGDRLLFYSDGIINRENSAGMRYEIGRLMSALEDTRTVAAADAVDRLARDNDGFARGSDARDDQTLLMVGIG